MILSNFLDLVLPESNQEEYESILKRDYKMSHQELVQYRVDHDQPMDRGDPAFCPTSLYKLFEEDPQNQIAPNVIWENLLSRLLKKEPCPEMLKGLDIFIGQVPDYRINSCIIHRKSTQFMVLINSGLMLSLFRISRIFVASYPQDEEIWGVPEKSFPQGLELIQENFKALFMEEKILPIEIESFLRNKASFHLTEFLKLFVIAHELGHLVNSRSPGHRTADKQVEEFKADVLGYQIYRQMFDEYQSEAPRQLLKTLFYAAPHLLFWVYNQVEKCYVEMGIKIEDNHPSAFVRSDILKNAQMAYGDECMSEIDSILSHFALLFAEPKDFL